MNNIDNELLKNISDDNYVKPDVLNIRKNGEVLERKINEDINIISKKDLSGIDVFVKERTSLAVLQIPVIITMGGLKDTVYNDFNIGDNSNVIIFAGCGIHNKDSHKSVHNGIHRFNIGKGCKVKYIEKHYCEGIGDINPTTEIYLDDNCKMEMETVQIKGINYANRKTKAVIGNNSSLIINEKIMTEKEEYAKTDFLVDLKGVNSSVHVVSRSVAIDNSNQEFISNIEGNNKCYGHVECDAIIKDKGNVKAIPMINAKHVEANLIHEASIGKIAGEQLIKLMTLGLNEKEAETEIINGFLK